MDKTNRVLNFGIIGCGAITEQYYLPAFKQLQQAKVTHLVDLDEARGKTLAKSFEIPNFLQSYENLNDKVDAVIIATPPDSHIEISHSCYMKGIHVLCEKPLAKRSEDVEKLMASERDDIHIAVGMVRRMNPSSQLLKHFIQNGYIGKAIGFKVEEGSEFKWPLQTPHLFSKNGFGGILMDTGTHIFDLLSWCLNGNDTKINLCRDDNMGGVDSNVYIEAVIKTDNNEVFGSIDLSFTRTLPNLITIIGESGKIEIPARGGSEIKLYASNDDDHYYIIRRSIDDPTVRFNPFEEQIKVFTNAVLNGEIGYVTIKEALKTIRAIESCREVRELQYFSWETKNIEKILELHNNG
jgi:predicted dehydrogenase